MAGLTEHLRSFEYMLKRACRGCTAVCGILFSCSPWKHLQGEA